MAMNAPADEPDAVTSEYLDLDPADYQTASDELQALYRAQGHLRAATDTIHAAKDAHRRALEAASKEATHRLNTAGLDPTTENVKDAMTAALQTDTAAAEARDQAEAHTDRAEDHFAVARDALEEYAELTDDADADLDTNAADAVDPDASDGTMRTHLNNMADAEGFDGPTDGSASVSPPPRDESAAERGRNLGRERTVLGADDDADADQDLDVNADEAADAEDEDDEPEYRIFNGKAVFPGQPGYKAAKRREEKRGRHDE